ncbi:MAG: T9SS type A sorting domain-containing protein [Bacteroidota bacterium]
MKKLVLPFYLLIGLLTISLATSAQKRYVDDVFSEFTKVSNILYDSNRSFNILYGSGYPIPAVNSNAFITANLYCDIYSPTGDTVAARPVVLVLGTGSFIPVLANKQATGSKNDSAIAELCARFAKKGYVAVAVNYRQGWRATSTVQEVATQDLLQATYRGMQDVRNCIRFLRTSAATYGIDTGKIVVGGQGTGGYIALAFGTVDKAAEIETNSKFLRGDFTPMVNRDTLGDWTGKGGHPYFNYGGDSTISSKAHMIFNYGGSMGDSTWLEANSLPMVGLHVVSDPYAPYMTGDVRVPNGPTVIQSASGAGVVIPMANSLGVNAKLNSVIYPDALSARALQLSGNVNNLYPLYPSTTAPFDGAPWEWWDRTAVQAAAGTAFYSYPMPANGRAADSLSMLTNPNMTPAKGKAYIDTVVNFVAPRIAVQFSLVTYTPVGLKEEVTLTRQLTVYPNPAKTELNISLPVAISTVSIVDMTGREVLKSTSAKLDVSTLKQGLYFVNVKAVDGRTAVKRIVIE